jgi:hypothetical protein
VKFPYREQLTSDLYQRHSEVIHSFLAEEEIPIASNDNIEHWLNKLIWANNISVREGKHLRLSIEGRHLFHSLSQQNLMAMTVQSFDPTLAKDHLLWLDLSRKCPVPWYVHSFKVSAVVTPANRMPRLRGQIELWEFGPDASMLSFMLATGDIKKWENLLNF